MKKIVDERQELELMKIERTGFWILFFALAADILLKVLFFHVPVRELIGEHTAFLAGITLVFAVFIFLLMLGVLSAMGEYTKKRQKKLDETYGED